MTECTRRIVSFPVHRNASLWSALQAKVALSNYGTDGYLVEHQMEQLKASPANRNGVQNQMNPKKPTKTKSTRATSTAQRSRAAQSQAPSVAAPPKLLSGGNPQIAKADGDAPVQAFIAAMPGWKHEVGRRLDVLILRTVPNVRQAVRWSTPFYGIEGQGWFLGSHCLTKYIKVAFFQGTSLRPVPPVESKQPDVRYLHIHEDEPLDEELLASWIRQAAELPGSDCF